LEKSSQCDLSFLLLKFWKADSWLVNFKNMNPDVIQYWMSLDISA
jgi:hypothetical protein